MKNLLNQPPVIAPRLAPSNVRAIVEAWMHSHNNKSFLWRVQSVETSFRHKLTSKLTCLCGHPKSSHTKQLFPDFPPSCTECPPYSLQTGPASCPYYCRPYFVGRRDLDVEYEGEPAIVDHKTTAKIDPGFINQYRNDSQITGYLWSRSVELARPVRTAFVNAIPLVEIPRSDRKCSKHRTPFSECGIAHVYPELIGPITRSERQLDEWHSTALTLARRFRWLAFEARLIAVRGFAGTQGTFNEGCKWCEAHAWCYSGRNPNVVDSMFEPSTWSPLPDTPLGIQHSGKLYIDNSTLKATAKCDTQATMRYALRLTTRDQKIPALAGQAVHAALEEWFRSNSAKSALTAFDKLYS